MQNGDSCGRCTDKCIGKTIMKQTLILLILLIFITSCTKTDIPSYVNVGPVVVDEQLLPEATKDK